MAKDLSKIAKQKKIKYFLISFVDLFGVLRSKLVPTEARSAKSIYLNKVRIINNDIVQIYMDLLQEH